MPPYHLGIKSSLWSCFIPYLEDNQTCVYRQVGASEFSGMEWWNGMVEWTGMVDWNGTVLWYFNWWSPIYKDHLFIKTVLL